MRFTLRRRETPRLIERLHLDPDDILVVKCTTRVSQEQAEQIIQAFDGKINPPVEIIVVSEGFDLAVIKPTKPQGAAA